MHFIKAAHLVCGDTRVGGEDKGDNETVKTQHFGENEDKNLKSVNALCARM